MAILDNLDYEVNGVPVNYEIVPEIAPLFNATTAYAAGDQVIHEGIRCKFTAAHPAGAWIGTDVEEMPTVAEELASHDADITELKEDFTNIEPVVLGSYVVNTASGAVASFDDGADGVPVKDLVAQIVPVQAGSGDPAPDNVRPISGWTGANVSMTGKNLALIDESTIYSEQQCTKTFKNGGVEITSTGNYGRVGFTIDVKSGETYTVSCKIKTVGSITRVALSSSPYWNYKTYGVIVASLNSATLTAYSKTITAVSDKVYLEAYAGGVGVTLTIEDFQLELGSTATAYEPYQGNIYAVDWTTDAGTVYGGTLDVTTGVLTVDRVGVDMSTLSWSYNTSYTYAGFTATAEDMPSQNSGVNIVCSLYAPLAATSLGSFFSADNNNCIAQRNNGNIIMVQDARYTDAASFKAGMSGQTLVYPLAEPQTYQLTPQEVSTLLGQNNIWADCGDTTVEYRADPKLYIEKLTAPAEDDMVANTNIPDATYFMVGNTLYLSTTTIPAGDTINPGTNCTKMDLAAALNAINS